ncbi:MAG: hypothetical protein GY841_02675 [FCB group bacterium]|nr:hypothetical protein [FCB group bacterium]
MFLSCQSRVTKLFFIIGCVLMVSAGPLRADEADIPILTLRISDTTVHVGDTNAWVSVYMMNYYDSLAGFSIMVVMDRHELMEFRTDTEDSTIDTTWQYCDTWEAGECTNWVDTMIIDTVIISGAVDTSGSAISSWEYVAARPVEGSSHNMKITALADKLGPPRSPALPPNQSEILLFRLKTRVYEDFGEDTTIVITDSTVTIMIVDDVGKTSFSNPEGNLIGTITQHSVCDTFMWACVDYDSVLDSCLIWDDTNTFADADSVVIDSFWQYWYCDDWDGDTCLNWIDTTEMDAESIWLYAQPWTVRDMDNTIFDDGSCEIIAGSGCLCGDCNGDEAVNVGDPVWLINYIFKGGPAPVDMVCADVNSDTSVNVGDAVYLINFIFKSGLAPSCLY